MMKLHRTRTFAPFLFLLLVFSLFVCPAARLDAAAYPPRPAGANGIAVSTHPLADEVGMKILNAGGNAVDAAVAVGYALSVVYPSAGNLGGGGFAVMYVNGEAVTLDFREKAPAAAFRDMYLDADGNVLPSDNITSSLLGYRAAGVPGTVLGLNTMLEKYGTKSLGEVLAPSIELAQNGFRLRARDARSMANSKASFELFESSRKYFLKPDGSAYGAGELFVQKDLAETLKRISQNGSDGFYKGTTAQLIADDMAKNGGLITMQDLADYHVVWRNPAKGTYRGYDILSMAPPSSGGTHIVQILNIMENADVAEMGFGSAATIHLMAEAMRYAFADRSEYMGDPDYVDVPVDKLVAKDYAKTIYDQIVAYGDQARPSSEVKPGLGPMASGGTNTTHYSVVDRFGNAVSITYTINGGYGAKAAVMGAGFLLNNEMDDFAAKPGEPNMYGLIQGEANAIAPGKRPLSSMSPSIVLKGGKVYLVTGSPGGSRIITTTLQTIVNVIDHGMNVSQAVAAPRIHMQWYPDQLDMEASPSGNFSKDTLKLLEGMGYKITNHVLPGDVDAIMIDHETGAIYGAHDPRTYEWPETIGGETPNPNPDPEPEPEPEPTEIGHGSGGCSGSAVGLLAVACVGCGVAVLRRKRG